MADRAYVEKVSADAKKAGKLDPQSFRGEATLARSANTTIFPSCSAAAANALTASDKDWVLKRGWTDEEFQDGPELNKARLCEIEQEFLSRLKGSVEAESGGSASSHDSFAHEAKSTSEHSYAVDSNRHNTENLQLVMSELISDDIRAQVVRRPEVLGSALDIVGAYLKNYEVDKAGAVMETIMPVCREKGGLWLMKALNHMGVVRMKQARPAETVGFLEEAEKLAEELLAEKNSKEEAWEFWETLYRNFSWCHGALHNEDKAVEYTQKAIDVKELAGKSISWFDLWDLGRSKATIALISNDPQNIKKASGIVEKALRQHQEEEVQDLVMRAKIWHTVGECSFALAHLKHGQGKGVQLSPDIDDLPLTDEARTLYKRALKCFQQAYRLFLKTEGRKNPLTGSEAEAVTWTLIRLRQYNEAKPFLLNALEAQSLMQNDWGSGGDVETDGTSSTTPALLRSLQTVDRILEAHRHTDDRAGLQQYFDPIEKLCDNVCRRMRLLPKERDKKDALVYERLISSCSMVLVASGTDDGIQRSQKMMNTRMWEKPKTAHAQVCSDIFRTLSNEGTFDKENSDDFKEELMKEQLKALMQAQQSQ